MSSAWSASRSAVHWWAVFTAILTFVLLCSGGLVTSHGAGMAVPDWPNTFGYNMFLFPISRWVGGIFYEHTHRLIASGIGLMTVILSVALWRVEPRRWVKLFGLFAVVAVCLQGLLGGLRVVLIKDEIGVFHALLAQSFFVAISILAIVTSRRFAEKTWADYEPHPTLRWWALAATGLIFLQLGIGAAMRHEHIGLSIPDFPLAYGNWLPDTSRGGHGTDQCRAGRSRRDEDDGLSDLGADDASRCGFADRGGGNGFLLEGTAECPSGEGLVPCLASHDPRADRTRRLDHLVGQSGGCGDGSHGAGGAFLAGRGLADVPAILWRTKSGFRFARCAKSAFD